MLRFPDELPRGHPDRDGLAAMAQRLGVPGRRIALSASMADYIASGLACRPVLVDVARQQALTAIHLRPVLVGLKVLLLRLRKTLDPALRAAKPVVNGKPYPLGQCLEITCAVQGRLEALGVDDVDGPEAEALAALRAFQAAGGGVRRGWGDLRGQYFQNALIVGDLYIDVANDTVAVTKPPVEILPLAEADFSPIADYGHFTRIAGRYWKQRFLPNHILPEIAPYMPLICIAPDGAMRVGPIDAYMLSMTLAEGFAPSEQALGGLPLPANVFRSLAAAIRGGPDIVAATAEDGRVAALAACRAWRDTGRPSCATAFNAAILAAHDVNRRLATLIATPQPA